MTKRMQFVMILLAVALAACGGGGVGPTPVPSTTPPSPEPRLLLNPAFETHAGLFGFTDAVPLVSQAGKLKFQVNWDPVPPSGQAYLFLLSEQGQVIQTCYYSNYTCSQILAREMTETHPKQIEYRIEPGQRIFFWVKAVEGHVRVTVKVWFLPD